MPTIRAYEYRHLSLAAFSVIDLPQEESFNYLTVPRIENQKNAKETVAEIGD